MHSRNWKHSVTGAQPSAGELKVEGSWPWGLLQALIIRNLVFILKAMARASLVAQWLRIRLPMQGTRVRALDREDTTCRGATKPVCHNYWACALEPTSHNYWARVPQLLSLRSRAHEPQLLSPCATTTEPACLEPVLCNKRSHRHEKPAHRNEE